MFWIAKFFAWISLYFLLLLFVAQTCIAVTGLIA